MNLKQAQELLSDFIMKCETERVDLPQDALKAVIGAIQTLQDENKNEMGLPQIDAAIERMKKRYGVVDDGVQKKSSTKKERQTKTGSSEVMTKKRSTASISPTSGEKRSRVRIHKSSTSEILSTPAQCAENQSLVDKFIQLAEYEMEHGQRQRGSARLRAAKEIRDAKEVITSGAQARKLDGVGASAAAKVDAILNSGLEGAIQEYKQ